MKRKKHTPEQIVKKLREAEMELAKGANVADVSRRLAVSEQTYYRWKQQVRGRSGRSAGQGQRAGEAEHETQEDRGRTGHGHRRTEGDRLKKMVGPAGRRRAVAYLVSLSSTRSEEPAGFWDSHDRRSDTRFVQYPIGPGACVPG